tara:strand:+ start:101 stop:385 length:285 start_codon:yes stop_codon:yes gene_type:complete
MIEKGKTFKALDVMLTQKYGCQRLPQQQPSDPECAEEEEYVYYKNKQGLIFPVPPPPDGKGYKPELVKTIIESARLEVVVSLETHKNKPEAEST